MCSFLSLAITESNMYVRPLLIAFHGIIGVQISSLWLLNYYGGSFYSTNFANDTIYGYRDVSGIELYPEASIN